MSFFYINPIYFGIGTCLLGGWLIYKSLTGDRVSLVSIWLKHNESIPRAGEGQLPPTEGLRSNLEFKAFRFMSSMGVGFEKIKADLTLIGISTAQHAFLKIRSALFGVILSFIGIYLLGSVGVFETSNIWLLLAAGLGGVFGFILPDKRARELAASRREQILQSLSVYLDLVKILLAGGSHTDGALFQAAAIGKGWAFGKLKAAIDWSRVHGQPVPVGLRRLAKETDVSEVEELSAIISLADKEGASLKDTLSRKAELMAVKNLAEAKAKSNALAERMSLPTVVIAISFVAFIAYPALASLTTTAL